MLFLGAERALLVGPIFHELISGISEELRELRLRMMVVELPDASSIESELRRHELDGVIALFDARLWQSDLPQRLAEVMPAVWVMGPQAGVAVVDHVVPQNFGVGEMAFDYLRSRGCPRVAVASLPIFRSVASRVSVMRAMAFANAARSEGTPVDIFSIDMSEAARRMLGEPFHQLSGVEELADRIVGDLPAGSGVFLSTDQELARLYPLLLKLGVTPERDYMLVSCDNESATLAPLHPKPATIDINAKRIGREAVRRLIRRIRHPSEPPLVIEVPPTLVKP